MNEYVSLAPNDSPPSFELRLEPGEIDEAVTEAEEEEEEEEGCFAGSGCNVSGSSSEKSYEKMSLS